MKANPFNPQDPTGPRYFYGRKSIINRYKGNLSQDKPMNLMLVGDWGIGKTSTLKKLQAINTSGVASVRITITNEEEGNFEKFSLAILKELRDRFNRLNFDWEIKSVQKVVKAEKKEKKPKEEFLSKMEDLWAKAEEQGFDKIVLFLDDFDLMYPQQMNIRNCFQQLRGQGCNFMLVATSTPEILEEGDPNEPFIRFFDQRDLENFEEEDTKGMIRHILQESGLEIEVTSDLLEEIHTKTQGHPYYITLFMHEIIRANKGENRLNRSVLTQAEEEIMRSVNTHLGRKYNSLTGNMVEAIVECIENGGQTLRPKDLPNYGSSMCQRLCKKEVLKREGHGRYSFRHPLTREYFESELIS